MIGWIMAKDWTQIYKKYKGLWVALAKDETTVLGFGKTVKEAISKAKNKSDEMPYLFHVPEKDMVFVGSL